MEVSQLLASPMMRSQNWGQKMALFILLPFPLLMPMQPLLTDCSCLPPLPLMGLQIPEYNIWACIHDWLALALVKKTYLRFRQKSAATAFVSLSVEYKRRTATLLLWSLLWVLPKARGQGLCFFLFVEWLFTLWVIPYPWYLMSGNHFRVYILF